MSQANAQDRFALYTAITGERFGAAEVQNIDVFFPEGVRGWSDVLDCRIEPYDAQSIEENCQLAVGVHKKFILIRERA